MIFTPVPAEHVDGVWPSVAPLIAASCAHTGGAETVEAIHAKVRTGNGYMLALIDDDSAIVFERSDHCLHVVSIGGRNIVNRLDDFLDGLYRIASYVGARGVSFKGRKGWTRLLTPYGFRAVGEFMEVQL